jgi:uncharacterized protein
VFQNVFSAIKRHPVFAYFALTLAISWGGVFMISGGLDGFPANTQEVETLLPFVVLLLAIGPVFTGILLTVLLDGRAGVLDFAERLLRWRVGVCWYAAAFLLAPLLAAVTLLGLSLFSPVFVPGVLVSEDKAGLIISALAAGLVAGLFEEPGWTGFATPRLRQRNSLFTTGLMIGFMWGFWHLIVALWGSGTPTGEFSGLLFLPQFFFYAAVLPAYRVLMTWVYEHTHSLLISILMHLLNWYITLAVALWGLVGVVFVTQKKEQPKKTKIQSKGGIPPAVNQTIKFLLRSLLHGILSKNFLLITFTGHKSGKVFTTQVSYSQDGDTLYIFSHAAWWKNLHHDTPITLRLRGKDVQGLPEVVADDKKAVAAGLMAHLRHSPYDAPFYGVTLDENKNHRPKEVEAGAQITLMIRVVLC